MQQKESLLALCGTMQYSFFFVFVFVLFFKSKSPPKRQTSKMCPLYGEQFFIQRPSKCKSVSNTQTDSRDLEISHPEFMSQKDNEQVHISCIPTS